METQHLCLERGTQNQIPLSSLKAIEKMKKIIPFIVTKTEKMKKILLSLKKQQIHKNKRLLIF